MATSYTGLRVQDTYNAIIKIGDNSNLSATPKLLSDGVGNDSPLYLSGTRLGIGISPAYQFHTSGNAKIGGNLIISGNLTVNGTLTYLNVEDLAVEDPLIKLAKDNTANTLDIGLFGKYVATGTKYKGFFNDASDDKFKLFIGTTVEPTTTVDTSASGYTVGTLVANLEGNVTGGTISGTTGTFSGELSVTKVANANWLASFTNTSDSGHGLIIQAGGTSGTRYITQWKDAAGTERFHMDDTGEAYFQNSISATQFNPTNIVTNKVVKFDGTTLNDSIISDDGATVTIAGALSGTTGAFSGNVDIDGNLQVDGTIKDSDGDAGTSGQLLSSTGTGTNWIDFEADTAKRLEITVKNVSGGSLTKGTVVHAAPTATPPSGNVIEVVAADANVAASMPAIGVLNETIADEAEGEAVMFGAVSGIDTLSFSIGDELYVSETAGEFTATKPTAYTSQVQKIAVVIKSHASNGSIKVFGAGRANDVPNRVDRNMNFIDDTMISFGDDTDFKIYHDAVDSYLQNQTGHLIIQNLANDKDIVFKSDNGSGGVIEYFRLDGSTNTIPFGRSPHIVDNLKLYFGNDTVNDASIKWDSTASQLFISGESKFLNDLYCVGDVYLTDGTNSSTLQFENDVKTRKIVLYEGADNDYQFYGFGVENSTLVYSTYSSGDDHVFFVGVNSTNRSELMRIKSTGDVNVANSIFSEGLYVNSNSAVSGTQVAIVKDGDVNLQRWGTSSDGTSQDSYRFRIDQNMKFIANSGSGDTLTIFSDTGNIQTSGTLGVGTTDPQNPVHVDVSAASGAFISDTNIYALEISNSDTTAGNAVGMTFGHGGFHYTNFIASVRTTTGDNPAGDLVFGGRSGDAAAFVERMRITKDGLIKIGSYGSGTHTGTVAKNLAVDSSGNIIETDGGVVDGSGTANYIPKWSDANTLTDSVMYESSGDLIASGNLYIGDDASNNQGLRIESGNGTSDYGVVRFLHGGTNRNTIHAFSQYWQSGTIYGHATDTLNLDGNAGVTIGPWNDIDVAFVQGSTNYFKNAIGIGQTTPTSSLHITQSTPSITLETSANANDPIITLKSDSAIGVEGAQMYYDNSVGTFHIQTTFADDAADIVFHTATGADQGTNNVRMRIGGNGNVGIGGSITAPEHKLVVGGNIGFGDGTYNGGVYSRNTSTDGGVDENWGLEVQKTSGIDDYNTRLKYYPSNGTSRKAGIWNARDDKFSIYSNDDTEPDVIIPYGLLGIGSTNPSRGLTIDKSNQYASLEIIKSNSGNQIVYLGTGSSGAGENPILQLKEGTVEKIRLYSTGDSWINGGSLGIGNSNPSAFNSLGATAQIVIGDASAVSNITMYSSTGGYGSVAFADSNASSSTAQYAGLIQYYHIDNSMTFYTASTTRMSINTDGRIVLSNSEGIQLSAKTSTLYATDGALSYYSASNGVYLNGAGASGWLRLQASGVENDRNSINIYGSAGDYMNFRTANSTRLTIDSNGDFQASVDADKNYEFGKAHIGYIGHADHAGFSHIDQNSSTSYSLLQNASGQTYLNAPSGQDLRFRIQNNDVGCFNGSSFNFGVGTNDPDSQMSGTNGISIVGNYASLGLSNGTTHWLTYLTPNADRYRIWNSVSNEVMTILSGGNVGIDNDGPNHLFELGNSNSLTTSGSYKMFSAGAFGVLFRNNYDCYIAGNTQYTSSGWVNKYGGRKSSIIGLPDGQIEFNIGTGTTQGGASNLTVKQNTSTNGTTFFSPATGTGSGDFTNVQYYPYKIDSDTQSSDYWRIPHLSGHSAVAGVYNYETGKNVYWGEPSDTGTYEFRGRYINATSSNTKLAKFVNSGGSATFEIGGSSNSNYCDLIIASNSGTGEIFKAGTAYTSYGGALSLNIYNSNGDICFHPSGTANIMKVKTSGITVTGSVTASGDVIAFSDKKVKTNIKTIDNGLQKVLNLRGVSYNRTDIDDKSDKIGVIAQEVKEVLPEVVSYDDEKDLLGVDYGKMAGVFIEAIKELKAEVDSLKQEIKQLKK